jgi:NOL1/NOP2/fmu family ribosome biogenesis protein
VAADGPEVAFRKGSTWFPSYALAMRRDSRWTPAATLPLDEQQAVAFVCGSVVPAAQRGWAVATWQGRALGWVKGDGTRAKNHLPKPARLAARS